jgi:hypothetical protein
MRQPDEKLRALNMQPSVPGPRDEVYCTKVGTTHPEEMYIVGGHMDGHGWGEAANDDGSGAALVMELARLFSSSDVKTERSVRFILWNNEETGLNGAYANVAQRAKQQGIESADGRVRDLQRRGFPAGAERRADDARSRRALGGHFARRVAAPPWPRASGASLRASRDCVPRLRTATVAARAK